jgi:hypothetical protein
VSVKSVPPALAEMGLRLVMVGAGLEIVKGSALDVPPPGAGLTTVTLTVPAVAMSAAVMSAVSLALLTKVVVLSSPSQRTVESLTKLAPLTVSVKAGLPAVAESGLRLVMVGPGEGSPTVTSPSWVLAGIGTPPGAPNCT